MKFLMLLSLLAFSFSTFSKESDPVVATVNGKKILLSELDKHYQQSLMFVSGKKVTRRAALEDLINRIAGIDAAKSEKLQNDPVVQAKMEDVLYHAKISKDLEDKFKTISISDDEIKKYYETHKEYRTAHILFRIRAVPTQDEVKKAYETALQTFDTVSKNPDEFSKVANSLSQSSAAANGGDLGFQPPTAYAPEYFEAISGKSVGFISPPVRTQFGFHIIKVLGVRSFDEVEPNVYKKIVYDIKRDKILEEYYRSLKSKAKIVLKVENVENLK